MARFTELVHGVYYALCIMQLADEVRWLSHIGGGDPRIFSPQAYLTIVCVNRDSQRQERLQLEKVIKM